MSKIRIEGTQQRVSPEGAAWIERQVMEFRCVHHRDPLNSELIALVERWREIEADTANRRSERRIHKQVCAAGDYRWQSSKLRRGA